MHLSIRTTLLLVTAILDPDRIVIRIKHIVPHDSTETHEDAADLGATAFGFLCLFECKVVFVTLVARIANAALGTLQDARPCLLRQRLRAPVLGRHAQIEII